MVAALFHKLAFSGLAATLAAGASLVNSASVEPAQAYGTQASRIEAQAAADHAAYLFNRADLNNDGALDEDEYSVLAIVTAELARLNGFVAVDVAGGVKTVALPHAGRRTLSEADKSRIVSRSLREFSVIAGDDLRLAADEFASAQLEQFFASDVDRNGVLAGGELTAFAQAQSKLAAVSS